MTKKSLKIPAAIATILLAVAGCSGGSTSDGTGGPGGSTASSGGNASSAYCVDLATAKKDFRSFGAGNFARLDKDYATFHNLAGEAPASIKDDWAVLDGSIVAMQKAFTAAGLKFADASALQSGKTPKGVDASKLKQVSAAIGGFSNKEFTKISTAIVKHAKDECKVDFSKS